MLTITREEIEGRVLRALHEKLLDGDLFEEFCDAFNVQHLAVFDGTPSVYNLES